jgi:hypothetical protein
MSNVWYAIGDLFYATFKIVPLVGPFMNIFIWLVIGVLFVYWMGQLMKFRKSDLE